MLTLKTGFSFAAVIGCLPDNNSVVVGSSLRSPTQSWGSYNKKYKKKQIVKKKPVNQLVLFYFALNRVPKKQYCGAVNIFSASAQRSRKS
jgi:hypothetical protein